ncbi:AAA family ATPase, partial [Myxococcota bacterium]|nr:AAA family ATPase [Myxococcota bacterium]
RSNSVRTSRSTVASVTELTDFLKLLFARVGTQHCPSCKEPVQNDSPQSAAADAQAKLGQRGTALVTFEYNRSEKTDAREVIQNLISQGFLRAYWEGESHRLEEIGPETLPHRFNIISDRLKLPAKVDRLREAIETAFKFGHGKALIIRDDGAPLPYAEGRHCAHCDIELKEHTPNAFSYNSPVGACDECKGFGRLTTVDVERVIPNHALSIKDGAIKVFKTEKSQWEFSELLSFCRRHKIPVNKPWKSLTHDQQELVMNGEVGFKDWDKGKFPGVLGFFDWLRPKRYKMHVRVFLSRYRGYVTCPSCSGGRFKDDSLDTTIGGKTIAGIFALSIGEAKAFFEELSWEGSDAVLAAPVLHEIRSRLHFLVEVGLEYLTLERQSRTLSGGEVQRLNLTTALGAALVNTLYVLDEPSVGLHPRDNARLVEILKRLRDLGNTVVVVEHDPDIVAAADHIIDIGPHAGEKGGELVFKGTPAQIKRVSSSLTGKHLKEASLGRKSKGKKPSFKNPIRIKGASENNLQNINITIPKKALSCITGVSGSGKS